MAIIILEGLDRTGKSTVAEWYGSNGWKVVHLSAPDKKYYNPDYTGPSYFDWYIDLVESNRGEDVVYDRSAFAEALWAQVYNRQPLISDDELDMIMELENTMSAERILMYDPNSEAHWQRCVDNKEPLTKSQFVKARALYSTMADKYGFHRRTLKDFPDAEQQPLPTTPNNVSKQPISNVQPENSGATKNLNKTESDKDISLKSKEQQKLDKANVINEVLSKRIIKSKGGAYDDVERGIRHFLNGELGKIFGNSAQAGLTNEEVELLKFFCKRLKDKETE